jgi:hypothetical protein
MLRLDNLLSSVRRLGRRELRDEVIEIELKRVNDFIRVRIPQLELSQSLALLHANSCLDFLFCLHKKFVVEPYALASTRVRSRCCTQYIVRWLKVPLKVELLALWQVLVAN